VIPFTVIEIECSEEAGEITDGEDVVHSQDQMDTAVWFSSEPLLNGRVANVLSWDYYPTPDVGLFAGKSVYTPDACAGTFQNNFSGYWDAEGGGFSASGLGAGELAGMQIWLSGGGIPMESALEIVKDDPRVVDGNPCYPDPMPTHDELSILYGQIVDRRSPDQVSAYAERSANEQAVRRYLEELWNQGDLSVADEVLSEDFVSHWMPQGEGREFMKEDVARFRVENPGAYFPIEDLTLAGDKAYITTRIWAMPEGAAEGDEGEPTSRFFLLVLRLENGQIAERWLYTTPEE
jgi:ketosteroid isomerase-like protein